MKAIFSTDTSHLSLKARVSPGPLQLNPRKDLGICDVFLSHLETFFLENDSGRRHPVPPPNKPLILFNFSGVKALNTPTPQRVTGDRSPPQLAKSLELLDFLMQEKFGKSLALRNDKRPALTSNRGFPRATIPSHILSLQEGELKMLFPSRPRKEGHLEIL
ncbi:MAG: hypothetical protein ACK5RO_10665 [Pseudobdellovibrionaceae bacterium]